MTSEKYTRLLESFDGRNYKVDGQNQGI